MKLEKPPMPNVDWYPAEAIDQFQRRHGLRPDGVVGPHTWRAVEDLESRVQTKPDALDRGGYSYGGAPIRKGVDRDPKKLLKPFADRLELVIWDMIGDGFEPLFWEGFRTRERARELARRRTGIVDSMHCYGIAGDIVDADDTHWVAPDGFWGSLRAHAVHYGLHVLFDRHGRPKDMPHVQAIPQHEQDAFRSMTEQERLQHVTQRLQGVA